MKKQIRNSDSRLKENPHKFNWLWTLLILGCFTLVIYYPAKDAPFLFDSIGQIQNNNNVKDLWSGSWLSSRRALAYFSFAVDHHFSGFNPEAFLFTNMLIHIAAGFVLYRLLHDTLSLIAKQRECKTAGNRWEFVGNPHQFSVFTALIWLVHPIQTQAVIYHVQRIESLMALLFLTSLLCLNRYIYSKKHYWLILVAITAVASTTTKEVGAVLPVVLLCYYYVFQSPQIFREQLKYILPVSVLFAALGIWFGWLMWSTNPMGERGFDSRLEKSVYYFATQTFTIFFYLKLVFVPIGQNLDHAYPYLENLRSAIVPFSLLAIAFACGCFLLFQRKPLGFLVLAFFFILAPTSSILAISDLAFEHRMYLPLATIVVVVLWAARFIVRNATARFALASAVVVLLTLVSFNRCQLWRNELALWQDSAAKAPHNPRVFFDIGTILAQENDFQGAISNFETALRLFENPVKRIDTQPNLENEVAYRLGLLYCSTGRIDQTEALYDKWFNGDETCAMHLQSASLFVDNGKVATAEKYFKSGLELAGNDKERSYALVEYGYAMLNAKRLKQGRALLEQAVETDNSNWKAHNNLGIAIMMTDQDLQAAEHHFKQATIASGSNPEAVKNLRRVQQMLRQQRIKY